MEKIIFHPAAVHLSNGAIDILAGVELSAADVQTLIQTANIGDPYNPVFLIHSTGYKQRLSTQDIEAILAEPLAAQAQEEKAKKSHFETAIG